MSLSEDEILQITVPKFQDLGRMCQKLEKMSLDFFLDNFDLWNTFRYFDSLKELKIKKQRDYGGSILVDSKTRIRPLVKLKKIKIQCQSIGFFFFKDISEFSPNIEVVRVDVDEPRHQLPNHSLTALSECKQLKELEFKLEIHGIGDGDLIYPGLDDIVIIHLLENCKHLNRIGLKIFGTKSNYDLMINCLAKWKELEGNPPKRTITFECDASEFMPNNGLPDFSRLDKLTILKLTDYEDYDDMCNNFFNIQYNKDSTMSAGFRPFHWRYKKDIWMILSRFTDLEQLVFCFPHFDFYKSVPNIEPLLNLTEITIRCLHINNGFFERIVSLAPNLIDFELHTVFELTNGKLKCCAD